MSQDPYRHLFEHFFGPTTPPEVSLDERERLAREAFDLAAAGRALVRRWDAHLADRQAAGR